MLYLICSFSVILNGFLSSVNGHLGQCCMQNHEELVWKARLLEGQLSVLVA
jgi:hypothetical protein